jgi:signal transduction histidine kinase
MMINNELTTRTLSRTILELCFWAVILSLFAWSLLNFHLEPTQPIFYGRRAIYSIILLSVILALLGRVLLLRILKVELGDWQDGRVHRVMAWQFLLFLDVAAPIYLAAGVLLGLFAAVLTALVTQLVVQGYTRWRGVISWTTASYHVAATALLVLIAAAVFQYIRGLFPTTRNFTSYLESWELIATLLASFVMMALLIAASLPVIVHMQRRGLWAACREYVHSPVFRFQLLVMSVAPLLPVVDIFDNVVAELAWIFFLVPLLAIYYLALNSTRLGLRTEELQRTLADLNSARRRQDELRDYASLITRVQEEERRRLARELHDDTAQALIALSLGLDGLGSAVEKLDLPQKDRDWLASLQALADHTLDEVRRACRDLRPSILDDLGLRAALEWLCDSSNSRGVSSSFACTGSVRTLTPEAEIAIFRIAQEALSNVWRHAQATRVEVELKYLPDRLLLRIQDDGQGFQPEKITAVQHDSQSGLGLLGMRERAMLVGAELVIAARPGAGCLVTLALPFERE